jgi:methionine-rich copper-binding protein CopC
MSIARLRYQFCFSLVLLAAGCAQIVPPQGGDKDVAPPKLLSVSPADSQLHIRPSKIELRFDEYIVANNPSAEVQIAPLLKFPLDIQALSKKLVVKIPDTLLEENTTYRINFGKAIQDLHEGNTFQGYSYTFSTGNYFDTLNLEGFVIDAATGRPDSGAMIVLHPATRSDSAIVREKPLYAIKANGGGAFSFKGLPGRAFRIYALKDANENLVFDGPGEMVGFIDSTVFPSVSQEGSIRLRIFAPADSAGNPLTKSSAEAERGAARPQANQAVPDKDEGFSYAVQADTSDRRRRTVEINQPLDIVFNQPVKTLNAGRINLSWDSAGIQSEALVEVIKAGSRRVQLRADWNQNAVYTLRLLKGFAQDSSGTDAMPGRYTFRTKREEDYAKLHIHLPTKYYGEKYILEVLMNNDTIYHRPVRDSMVHLSFLAPGTYGFRVISDANGNGKWDTGDLLGKRQPEEVIPYEQTLTLKPGWENLVDFEEQSRKARPGSSSPGTRDAPR